VNCTVRQNRIIESGDVFTHRTALSFCLAPINRFSPRNAARPIGIGLDDAGIHSVTFTTNKSLGHAATQD